MAQKRRQIPKRQENVNNPKTASALFMTRSLSWSSRGVIVRDKDVFQVSNPYQFGIPVNVDSEYGKPVYPTVDNCSIVSAH
jgi:hypothetical protein